MIEVIYHSRQRRFGLFGIEWDKECRVAYITIMYRMWGFHWAARGDGEQA